MSTQLDAIHEGIGALLRDVSSLATNQSALHVKVDALSRVVHRIAAERMRDRFDIERAHRRITSLEHQMALVSDKPDVPDWQPDPREITGTHDFAVVKAQHEEMLSQRKAEETRRRDSGIWWKRQRWVWIAAALGVLFSTLLSGCVGYLTIRFIK